MQNFLKISKRMTKFLPLGGQSEREMPKDRSLVFNSRKVYYFSVKKDCFMPNVEKMSVALTLEMAEMVRRAVETDE